MTGGQGRSLSVANQKLFGPDAIKVGEQMVLQYLLWRTKEK
jgi:hypothetical protein